MTDRQIREIETWSLLCVMIHTNVQYMVFPLLNYVSKIIHMGQRHASDFIRLKGFHALSVPTSMMHVYKGPQTLCKKGGSSQS